MAVPSDPENDAHKASQRDFIKALFESEFHIPIEDISTNSRCNNNFIHHVTFASPCASNITVSNKPGTSPILSGTTKVVFRVGHPGSVFNHAVKVENTVAVMQLLRQALSECVPVAHVHGWSKVGEPSGTGWIIEEYLPGIEITESKFEADVPKDTQRYVFSQIAQILNKVQNFKLPAAAANFGGLGFDKDGSIISGPLVVEPYTGPYPDMKSFYKDMLRAQLGEADKSPVAEGWREDGLRARLDAFAEKGLDEILSQKIKKHVEPRLIIGDVVINNFLFDPTTYQLTGIVDYDCSHTGHPLHEFFFSDFSVNYVVLADDPAIISALLHGYPSPLPAEDVATSEKPRSRCSPRWPVMVMFEEELRKAGAQRPSSIEGAEGIVELYKFVSEVCPWHFLMQRWIDAQTKEKLAKHKKEYAEKIDLALDKWGF